MSRHRFECLGQNFTAIYFDLCCNRAKECRDILLAFYLPFFSQQSFLCHDIILALLQELLRQCHDIKIHCRDIVLSSDFHYVATFIYLLQHFLDNPSHIMSRQSFEMSQQSLNVQLEFNFVFVTIYNCLLRHCLASCLELLLRHSEIMSRHYEIMS